MVESLEKTLNNFDTTKSKELKDLKSSLNKIINDDSENKETKLKKKM